MQTNWWWNACNACVCLINQYEEDEELLEDVRTENQQAIQTTNIQIQLLSSTMDTFASIISNNLNAVMKVLTTLTIVVSLPTLVASFYVWTSAYPEKDIHLHSWQFSAFPWCLPAWLHSSSTNEIGSNASWYYYMKQMHPLAKAPLGIPKRKRYIG